MISGFKDNIEYKRNLGCWTHHAGSVRSGWVESPRPRPHDWGPSRVTWVSRSTCHVRHTRSCICVTLVHCCHEEGSLSTDNTSQQHQLCGPRPGQQHTTAALRPISSVDDATTTPGMSPAALSLVSEHPPRPLIGRLTQTSRTQDMALGGGRGRGQGLVS